MQAWLQNTEFGVRRTDSDANDPLIPITRHDPLSPRSERRRHHSAESDTVADVLKTADPIMVADLGPIQCANLLTGLREHPRPLDFAVNDRPLFTIDRSGHFSKPGDHANGAKSG